jgi:hypothetical protein
LFVLLGRVDAMVADSCFDDGYFVAVLNRAELFELLDLFQGGRWQVGVFK